MHVPVVFVACGQEARGCSERYRRLASIHFTYVKSALDIDLEA